ncbi:MAG: molybdopterin-dependent oxidoreductase [Candidatus Odinarchaeota archaeon]
MRKDFKVFSTIISYLFFIILLGVIATPLIILGVHESQKYQITPNDEFFVFYSKSLPDINISTWTLEIDGNVSNPLTFSYGNFTSLPSIELVATLQCVAGVSGTALWKGVSVESLLNLVHPTQDAMEVVFYAVDGFSASLTIDQIINYDILLAYEMNGETLPLTQGYPLRVVAPYHYGYKWVRWVDHVEIVNFDYKGTYASMGYSDEGLLSIAFDYSSHAFLFSISFILFGLSMISGIKYSRYGKIFKKLPKFISRKFHLYTSTLCVLFTTITFISWLNQVYVFVSRIFYSVHGIISLLLIIFLILSYFSGLRQGILKSRKFSWHGTVSSIAFLLFFISIFVGLFLIL